MKNVDCTVLALIPARAGSKSLPNKNVRLLKGKPLIQHSIECAQQSRCIDRVLVTTDSPMIANLSRKLGAEVPFLRPASISGDRSRDISFVQHALRWLREDGVRGDILFVLLRPTEPHREPEIVDAAIRLLRKTPKADSARSVSLAEQTPYKMWRQRNGRLIPVVGTYDDEMYNMPRQILPAVYWQNGYVDVFWDRTVTKYNSITGRKVLAFETTGSNTNIDTLSDLRKARKSKAVVSQVEKRFSS